ncbi:MAG TPA: hypothetical protein VMR62_36680 [Bryobacteraceae bacterium]|nr:hypothetical protein [Bryobacteraceae bacterium]
MATQRLTHAQREGMVMQELQGAFPGFVDVPSWAPVADDPPDFIGQGPGGSVGLELVEWLDGTQMGVAQAKKAYREALGGVLAGGWNSEYQPMHLSSAVVCPFWHVRVPKSDMAAVRAEFWQFVEDVDRAWLTNRERVGDHLLADHSTYPLLAKYVESIRLRGGEQGWKTHGYCWIDIAEDGGAFDPLDVVRTLEQAIHKKVQLYADPASDANLRAKKLDRLELLVHGGFNLYAYNTPRGRLSVSEIAAAAAVFYAGLPASARRFDRIWIFNSLNPAGDLNELVGWPRETGRLRWLAELWPDFGVDSRSIG